MRLHLRALRERRGPALMVESLLAKAGWAIAAPPWGDEESPGSAGQDAG